jgi:hypothetical protein
VAPGQHLRPWPLNPEQQPQHAYPEQPYHQPGQPEPQSGRHAAEEELRRARAQGTAPGAPDTGSIPIFVPRQRFVGLAVTALILGIVGLVGGVVGALVGTSVAALQYLTIGLAALGAVLGVIAVLGTRKVLAALGTVLCVGAVVVALTAQVAEVPEGEARLGGTDDAMQDVALQDCTVVREGAEARAEATLEISNRTDQRQSYNITVTVNDKGGPRVGEIHAIATTVEPGQTMVLSGAQASGTVSGRAQAGPADCRVSDVNRLELG